MEHSSFILLLLVLPLLALLFKYLTKHNKPNLPPSPPQLPIIGNLLQLGKLPHRSFRSLSEKYGPLILLRLGYSSTLVISSPEMAREMVKSHDIVFSNRPKTTAAKIFLYGCKDVGFAPYGEYWRQVRKISVVELLSVNRVQSFHYVREEEVNNLIDRIRVSCSDGGCVDLTNMLQAVSNDIVSRCVLGKKVGEGHGGGSGNIGELSRRLMVQFSAFCFGDSFPYLGWMDVVTGHIGRLNKTFRAVDAVLDQVIEEHMAYDHQSDRKDFVDILLQLQHDGLLEIELTRDNIKAILLDMIVGGTDTTATTLEWAMAELVRNPNAMNKAQEEVRRVVKSSANIHMNDISEMSYLKCVVKETMRLHPPVPLLAPRETSTAITMGGYHIPAKTKVFVNIWAIQRDPKLWDRAEEFVPERFMTSSIDYKGLNFEYIPFGTGRRGCPGMSFGVYAVEYVLANLLFWFDWKVAGSQELDMTEVYGLTVPKKLTLHLEPAVYSQ